MSADPLAEALAWLQRDGLLAYPTETVWGLGALATSERAVAGLRSWKSRGERQPLSILICEASQLDELGFEVSDAARRLMAAFWPGPLTLVLPCRTRFAPGVARADGAVGVRCSSHPLATALARRLRAEGLSPVTATSLNRSGEPAARSLEQARAACGAAQPGAPRLLEAEGAESGGEGESTVVDLAAAAARVLRVGALPAREVEPLLGGLP